MTTSIDKVSAVRYRINALSERAAEVLQQATSSEWPYSALSAEVRLFAHEIAETAGATIARAANAVHLTVHDCLEPITAEQKTYIANRFSAAADAKRTDADAVAAAAFAASEFYLDQANTLLNRAEACVRGEQTINGTRIARGPLWDK